jgi:hypothetical protein
MATTVYELKYVKTIEEELIELMPLKIKFLRQFLDEFDNMKNCKTDDESISCLVKCAAIAMKQYSPKYSTSEDIEDNFDMPTVYQIIDVAAGIKVNNKSEEPVKKQAESSASSWDDLDLAKLEADVFLLGIWKNYDELESSMSITELLVTIESKRDLDYQEKKFLAAMQGVDLDEASGSQEADPWEAVKARAAARLAGVESIDPNDITSLQGLKAQQSGFGIGMGLEYEKM